MPRKAFTLVELLVVIAIIGLLSTVAVVSLSSARVKARNAKRVADIKQLMVAFNLGLSASTSGTYPSTTGDFCISTTCYGGWKNYGPDDTVNSFFTPFMPNKPSDPSDGGARGYGGYIYTVWAGGTAPSGVVFTSGSYLNYLLEPPASCDLGAMYIATANYVQCLLKLE